MADVVVTQATKPSANQTWGMYGPFWTSPTTGYVVLETNLNDIDIHKTTDSGATWTTQDAANNPVGTYQGMGAYFDKETNGNSGTLIHVAYVDSTANTVLYMSFNTSDDTWGTERTVDSLTVSATVHDSHVSITVAKSGRIYVAATGDFDVHTENTDHSMRSSNDAFASDNQSETSPYSSDEEIVILLPDGVAADTDDICAVVLDATNQDLEFWKYDRSGTSWGVTSIDTAIALSGFTYRQGRHFDATTRHSDNAIICTYVNDRDTATADLKTAEITPATPTATIKADVITNTDDWSFPSIFINQQNTDVYVAYCGKDDGSETLSATVQVYYKLSTDDLGSWGTEAGYGALDDDLRMTHAGHMVLNAGGRYMPCFYNDDLDDILVNDGNDVEIAAVGGAATRRYSLTLVGVG